MADVSLLSKIKIALGITSDYHDETISVYIDEVIDYMKNAGVSESLIKTSAGVITRGVADLWNNSGGDGHLSNYFYDRIAQLVLKSKASGTNVST